MRRYLDHTIRETNALNVNMTKCQDSINRNLSNNNADIAHIKNALSRISMRIRILEARVGGD